MCLNRYFRRWLEHSLHISPTANLRIPLAAAVHFKPDLTYFVQVKLQYPQEGGITALPIEGNGSGDFSNLTNADGFLELERGKEIYEAGEVFGFLAWR